VDDIGIRGNLTQDILQVSHRVFLVLRRTIIPEHENNVESGIAGIAGPKVAEEKYRKGTGGVYCSGRARGAGCGVQRKNSTRVDR
jgi:hypothetical protein